MITIDIIINFIRIIIVNLVIFQILPERFSSFSFLIPLSICVIIYTFIKYGFKNYELNKKVIQVFIIMCITANYRLIFCNRNKIIGMLKNLTKHEISMLIIIIIICFLFASLFGKKEETNIEELPRLIREREYDLNRLKLYLKEKNTNIIGLNGNFGTGKSLIIEYLKKDLESEYYIIEIDVLSSNSDDIQIILMNEIDKILRSHGIFSRYSPKLRSFFSGNNILRNIELGFFYDDTIFINMIRGIKKEIHLLEKPLLIIYEDLDRINNFEVIQKILGISEKLSSEHIKIIYQYSKRNLEGILEIELGNLELSNNYLEKYIHKNINLTSIGLLEMVKFQLDTNEKYNEYITSDLMINILYVPKNFQINDYSGSVKIEFKPHLINMRRVEKFLSSTYAYIKNNNTDPEQDILIRTAIIFYLIEYFLPESYSYIAENKDLEDTFIFKYNNEYYTLSQLYKNKLDIESIFEDDFNKLNIWILESLGYKLTFNYLNETLAQKQINNNKKIEKRFKNIYSAGLLKYTNDELYAIKLIEDVLNCDKSLWESKYKSFNYDIDNRDEFNIFYFGVNGIISIFKAFNMIYANQRDWLNLLEFFKLQGRFEFINKSMFEAFSYIDLNDLKINIEIGKIISDATVIGNLNEDKYFIIFLKRYYRNWYGLTTLPGIELIEYNKLDLKSQKGQKRIIDMLEKHIQILEEMKNDTLTKVLNNKFEIEINVKVTKKLIEVINEKDKVKEGGVSAKVRSIEPEEIKLLKTLKEDGNLKEFELKAREYYFENKITKAQLQYLLKELEYNQNPK